MKYDEYKTGRYLSFVLRHDPQSLGVVLEKDGWTDVSTLINKLNLKGYNVDLNKLKMLVQNNNKQRYSFNSDYTKIKANQGHSTKIELNFKEVKPPSKLYHGTSVDKLDSILESGINKGSRHHVHLSQNYQTAEQVGNRHGVVKVLSIDSGRMFQDGFKFYLSDNNVWLTDFIPSSYIGI